MNLANISFKWGFGVLGFWGFGVALSLEWVDSLEQEPNLISTRYGRVEMRFHAYAQG